MGVTELVLILVIVLIVFGAGKLPKIGEGLGKALKGFKKEVHEAEPVPQAPEQAVATDAQVVGAAAGSTAPTTAQTAAPAAPAGPLPVPPQMGPAATPGTTAYMVAQQAWKPVTPPPAAPPPPPPGSPGAAPAQPAFKAEVNKAAVQRVMAQQAAMKAKQEGQAPNVPESANIDRQAMEAAGMQPPPAAPAKPSKVPTPQDMQNLGAGVGDALRTFREAANDVRRAIDPSMHQIKAEVEAAQKEIQGSINYVKEGPKVEEPPPK